jgi:hypothetical protein
LGRSTCSTAVGNLRETNYFIQSPNLQQAIEKAYTRAAEENWPLDQLDASLSYFEKVKQFAAANDSPSDTHPPYSTINPERDDPDY